MPGGPGGAAGHADSAGRGADAGGDQVTHEVVSGLVARLAVVDAVYDETLAKLETCSKEEALELVVLLMGRHAARLAGLTVRAQVRLAELHPPGPAENDVDEPGDPYSEFLADRVAPELAQSPRTVSNRLAQAWDLAGKLPGAVDALVAGELDWRRLLALFDVTEHLTEGQRAVAEAQMLAGKKLGSPTLWRRKARRLALRLDPAGAARRRREAHAERDVTVEPLEDGMARLSATLAAEDVRAICDRIDRLARKARTDGDGRPIAAVRADVLAALLLGNRREYVTTEIQVIAPIGTLAGLDDNPAELVGYGPIPAGVGRALAADARWRRVLTDPTTGTVLDLGRRRVPAPDLARLIRYRDQRCTFPGCAVPAVNADLDHTVPWARGGATAFDNLGAACRHHHRLKTEGGWRLGQPRPGVFVWTSVDGRAYRNDTNTNDGEGLLPDQDRDTRSTVPAGAEPGSKSMIPRRRTPAHGPCPF
ncbi:DUF222 domain-containing protein [Pseudofrankia sp. BMG5.37]|uniref:HNH endonuclease signature motif containing protein n=1 Tax=Pseudofrankia sp. BMG5.37 TaxID=3050035 RepID=UPI0037C7EF73